MTPFLLTFIQTVVILAIAPFSLGLVRSVKARLQGRQGASPFLPYISFATLLRKEMVISKSTSWVFRFVPFMVLAATLFLVLVLPLLTLGGFFSPFGDFVLVAAVLIIGSVFLVLGGLDVASAFGGMGSSREMTLAAMMEPVMITTFAAFALVSEKTVISDMIPSIAGMQLFTHPFLILSVLSLLFLALAENARYPVDNPATHLELTMVHEAMILEYSGPYLAMLEYASSLKLTVFSLLIANLIVPFSLLTVASGGMALLLVLISTVLKISIMMILLAILESSMAKMRFYRMQEYASGAFFLALGGLILALINVL